LYGEDEERVQVLGEEGGADLFPALYGTTSPLHFFRYEGESSVDIIPALLPVSSGSGTGPVGRFADATRHSTEPTATGQQALEVMKVLAAAYRSAAGGHEVLL
jgi:predicted dehydrogenase